mgnify:CR=1 FL=1
MKSTQYSEKTLEHFRNPRNVGTLEGEDVAVGRVGNPVCGDMMDIYIRVGDDDSIRDIKFQTFGCGSAVATSSMITELVKGMKLDDALKVSRGDVADALDGLPPIKMHCSNLAADALHEAIKNWRAGVGPEDAKKQPGGAACHPIPAEVAEVEARILPRASVQVPSELRRSCRRAVHSVAPQQEEAKAVRATEDRCVTLTPASSGMAYLEALLPGQRRAARYRLPKDQL